MIEIPSSITKELVTQSRQELKDFALKIEGGKELRVDKDGCALISLFNAFKLCGYKKNFEDFTTKLDGGACFDNEGQINWLGLNKLELDLKFVWMQDNEIPNCEKVNIDRLRACGLNSGNIAILKVQSLYGPERRHFMIFVKLTNEEVICSEASGKSGEIEMRSMSINEILGVRYLKKVIPGQEKIQ